MKIDLLCDTSPLVALIDKDDAFHEQALLFLKRFPKKPMITTWACMTEAMYLLYRVGGYQAQEILWELIEQGSLIIRPHNLSEQLRMRELMLKYQDVPMDFADASLVAACEELRLNTVFTFDSDFYAYRLHHNTPINVIPGYQ